MRFLGLNNSLKSLKTRKMSVFMPELYPEDQERVNKFLSQGVNSVERKPLRLKLLLAIIVASLGVISVMSYIVGRYFDFV